jgi:predicted nucleic acid-binding protein
MTTMDDEPTFVDTNILVYTNVPTAPEHLTARARLKDLDSAGAQIWISRQVLREYMTRLTRPQTFMNPVSPAEVTADIRMFEVQYEIAEDGPAVTVHLLDLLNAVSVGGKQVHDANIVATMLAHGLKRLLTHNVADFRRFSPWIDVIPLVPAP